MAGDLRMSWGISIVLVALVRSRGKKANFPKLQFLAHSVRLREGREDVDGLFNGKLRPSEISVRVEPWLNRAVSFAHALKLVEVDRGRVVSLTPFGVSTAQSIITTSGAMSEEIAFLTRVAPKLTDKLIDKIWRMEDLI
jgi:hypothetical protein